MIKGFVTMLLFGLAASSAALGSIAAAPASAGGDPARTLCIGTSACLNVRNNGKGPGIVGTTTFNENQDRGGAIFSFRAGLIGNDVSHVRYNSNAGVLGTSQTGTGVAGVTAFSPQRDFSIAQQGVVGLDNSTTDNNNDGVAGYSNHNIGVYGESFDPANGYGVWGQVVGGVGLFGGNEGQAVGRVGAGVYGNAQSGNAVVADGGDTALASLAIDSFNGGPLIEAFRYSDQTQLLYLDDDGNLTIAGTLTQAGSSSTFATTSTGLKVATYSAQQTARTMEDVGEARLVRGRAVVALKPSFASAIDARHSYLVFITPQSDTSGLFVSQKSATEFVVREHEGTSNASFDYRIVAQPYSSSDARDIKSAAARKAAIAAEAATFQRIRGQAHHHRSK